MRSLLIIFLTLPLFTWFPAKPMKGLHQFLCPYATHEQIDSLSNKTLTDPKYREIVMLTHLVDSAAAIEKYEYLHSEEGVWPEVIEAAKVSGINRIMIYRFENTLVMILRIPAEADVNEISAIYAASSPKLKEWADLMATFQVAPESLKPGEIWAPMKLIHHYENGKVFDD